MQANLAALHVLRTLREDDRPATAEEQQTLGRWSSWGAVPELFDETRSAWAAEREQLQGLIDDRAYAAARRTTINAHYTDPAYVQSIWAAVQDLGFDRGRVLEPGAGAGTFIGLAPAGADMVGVELDPSTAAIAQALYPDAQIRAESIADTPFAAGSFDAAVGNVPFADVRLHDPRHNRGGHSLHNHCIVKSLALTRPGGLVAVLSSRYTMDAQNPAARREMHAMADLLGAVRLPNGAHQRAAGTRVITDVLIFRRREADAAPLSDLWLETRPLELEPGQTVRVNAYFDEHPEQILGTLGSGSGQFGPELRVIALNTPIAADLQRALGDVTAAARRAGLTMTAPAAELQPSARAALEPAAGLWDGHLQAHPDGRFTRVHDGQHVPIDVPASQRSELRALLELRDRAKELLGAEAASAEDSDELARLRQTARATYEGYVDQYGPINRFTLRRTGRTGDDGQPRLARMTPPVMRTLRSDPFSPLVLALESFDDSTQSAAPATLLSQRTLFARTPVLGVDSADDALAVSMETRGRVDLAQIAQLLGCDEREARSALGELVYADPADGQLLPGAEYLSGNVRDKLDVARAAAAANPALRVNVQALQRVMPEELGMDDVQARLGAAWVDAETHQAFLREVLEDPALVVEHPGGSTWGVRGNSHSVQATSGWGTGRMPAPALAKAVLEQRPIQVSDEIDEGRRVVNPVETAAAVEKAEALQERFAEWVWEDPDRGARLLADYNRRFNSIVLRDYAADGERLTLPGLARTFQPRAHQRAAVARMIHEPAVGLFHQVGAGKTAEMVMGTMELRRLGLVSKPAVVVPNHMLEQFTREWLQLYPQTRLLAASREDLAGERRRAFIARVATNDWDAVLLTRSAFQRLPVSPDMEAAYEQGQVDALQAMLTNARGGEGLTVKRLEKQLLRQEQRIKALRDRPTDPGITFEDTGIDYLVVDELHDYKNLQTDSNIRDAAIDGSKRATDLHIKTEYLRSRHGDRVITGATATPIANSITEAHVMQRYLRPDLLADAGVLDFDSWAATFGRTVTEIEMAPSGGGNYRLQTRFARFQNVPEMLRMFHVFADVKTAEDLQLPTPELWARQDGQRRPETVLIQASPEISAYVADLGDRAQAVRDKRVTPEQDNMLKISTDGRKAALDMRMVDGQPSSTPSKLDVVAARVADIWRDHQDRVYRDPQTGEPSPVPGAMQIVFCDLGTPSERWNAYDELRNQLADHGVPRQQVRFIHEAANDAEKARLFASCRAGHVAVIIGSTAKMGVGTNIQARAIALHHVDCPWRPADVEQRDGRIMRQGNQNPEIGLYRYAVEGSFDAYSWQTVERKARFIAQVMRGRLDVREMDDVGDTALSFAEIKALASGDPLILDKAAADAERTRLERLQRAWQKNQHALGHTIAGAEDRRDRATRQLANVTAAIDRSVDTRGDRFAMTITGRHVTTRPDADAAISVWAAGNARLPAGRAVHELGEVGQLGGQTIDAAIVRTMGGSAELQLSVRDVAVSPASLPVADTAHSAMSLVRQLEHRTANLPDVQQRCREDLDTAQRDIASGRDAMTRPFKHADALTAAQERSVQIATQMAAQQQHRGANAPVADESTADVDVDELRRLHAANFPASARGALIAPRVPGSEHSPRTDPGPRPRDLER